MHIVIIPGFTGFPEETTFTELEKTLILRGHSVTKVAWPHFPEDLNKYNFSETIKHVRNILKHVNNEDLTILGFSMGGIIASLLATEFSPQKLGLVVTPYQAGSEEDLAGKYKDWQTTGTRKITSSKYGELEIPFSFIEDARKYNALNYVKEVHCPILFVAGELDKSVPWQVCRKLFENAPQNLREWHLISGMEHKYKNQPEMLKKVNEILINFIDSDHRM
jgi:esterase/lipase